MKDSVSHSLTAAQQGIWSGQKLIPDRALYNTAECVEISGGVDHSRLHAAVARTVKESEALRARFVDGGGKYPVQEISDEVDTPLPVIDYSADAHAWDRARQWMRKDLSIPLELTQGAVFNQALLKLDETRHLWYVKVHHIALDGFGCSLFIRRTAEWYSALAGGEHPSAPPFGGLLGVVAEEAAYRDSSQYRRDQRFWADRFADRLQPAVIAGRGGTATRAAIRTTARLTAALEARLHEQARVTGCSWAELLIAAVAAYLRHQTAADEVVIGLPSMGRLGSAAMRVPCMKMNILPLRISVPADMTYTELCADVTEEVRRTRRHHRYRYEQLRRDLHLIGGDRRLIGPVVNIMPFGSELRFGEHRSTLHNISAGPVEDLSFSIRCGPDGRRMRIEIDANPDYYSERDIDRYLSGFLGLLGEALTDPSSRLVELLPDHAGGPEPLSGGALPSPVPSVVALIRQQAESKGDQTALEHEGRTVSYRSFYRNALHISHRLEGLGVGATRPIAVFLPRGVEAITSFLGCLLSGAAYLPFDIEGPTARNRLMMEDARPAVVLTSAAHAAEARSLTATLEREPVFVMLDAEPDSAYEEAVANPPSPDPPPPGAPAYVIYTSGSTGQPKGVVISQGSLARLVAGATLAYGITSKERVMQFSPLHFDASVEEIFPTLCLGATLVIRTPAMAESIPALMSACDENRVSLLSIPTSLWHELVYSLEGGLPFAESVTRVIIGGEGALPERVQRWRALAPDRVRLFHTYGPTEVTVTTTCAALGSAPSSAAEPAEVPIGRLLPGITGVIIAPATRRMCRTGEIGELHLLGPNLASRYLGKPEQTERSFPRLPQITGSPRAYRSGDLVRLREDGQLVFVGRVDDEFKISGHRVDPAEVEAALAAHPRIREAAVVGQVLPDGIKRLVADIVPDKAEAAPDTAELRAFLRDRLPPVMIPAVYSVTDGLPKHSSGKIDRSGLRSLAVESPGQAADQLPQDDTTALVISIWKQVLGDIPVHADDDFFEVGGESLQTIQISSRLSVELGREIPVTLLFDHPTAGEFAKAVEELTQPH